MDSSNNRSDAAISKNLEGNRQTLDRICADLFEKLKNGDISDTALKSGAAVPGPQRLVLSFFGNEVIVDLESTSVYYKGGADGNGLRSSKKLDVFSSAIILHYLTNADGMDLCGEWISYRELPDGMFYFRTIPGVLEPVLDKYKNSAGDLVKRIEESGGHRSGDFNNGAVIYPFVNFPVLVIMDEESEEFEASLRVLFDRNGSHYIKTDVVKMILVYLVKILVHSE